MIGLVIGSAARPVPGSSQEVSQGLLLRVVGVASCIFSLGGTGVWLQEVYLKA